MRLPKSLFSLGLGATALVTMTASCESFESLPADAGASDATTGTDSTPPVWDSSGPETSLVDAGSASPCLLLDASLGHFCDDFDSDPARVDFAGWTRQQTNGMSSYNGIAASKPWAVTSQLDRAAVSAKALIVRSEPAGKKFRVRFDMMGDGPPGVGAPLYFARVVLDDTYVIALRAYGDGDAVVVSEATKTDAGVVAGPSVAVNGAPRLVAGKWIAVEIFVDEVTDKWVVTFDGKAALGSTFVPVSGQPRLRLDLGAEVVNATVPLLQNTTLHYDNVLIQADR